MPKISVIIPVYNVEPYIKDCLESLVNQTFKDAEYICINDGSTDNSLQILEEYALKDKRFKIITQKNQGQGVARNNGLDMACGEYIMFVDPDDWIELDTLECIYNKFQETNVEVIQFDFVLYYDKTKIKEKKNYHEYIEKKVGIKIDYFNWQDIKNYCLMNLGLQATHRAYKHEFLIRNAINFPNGKIGEDNLFAIKTTLLAKKIFYWKNKYFYYYRLRNGSSTNSKNKDNFFAIELIQLIQDFLKSNSTYNQLEKEFKKYKIEQLLICYRRLPDEFKKKFASDCKSLCTKTEYKTLLKKFGKQNNSFLENLFSIKNDYKHGLKYKLITILGIRFEVKPFWIIK